MKVLNPGEGAGGPGGGGGGINLQSLRRTPFKMRIQGGFDESGVIDAVPVKAAVFPSR